ncbi:hypothetical protein J6352_09615 [Burkholderia pseudomallei]|uniref:hypothetical protein n=1 Tax=Burkholderia pseudomallei TaxID=28450 RepID=UPI001AD740B6|nr:hypothetical protein [Burkholderia pseudomallei]MBO7771597.1 hypothetical protein [Burkholderia pseudomallei]MBO7905640.1 hypothetical protein [Burkholderia pseudomallei]
MVYSQALYALPSIEIAVCRNDRELCIVKNDQLFDRISLIVCEVPRLALLGSLHALVQGSFSAFVKRWVCIACFGVAQKECDIDDVEQRRARPWHRTVSAGGASVASAVLL